MTCSLSLLDRPAWHALTTHQSHLALGRGRARRFQPDYGPFAAAADGSEAALAALSALVAETGSAVLMEAGTTGVPPGLLVASTAAGVQMVAATPLASPNDPRIVALGEADAPAMRALATLTEPGPFLPRTHRLGRFFGIRDKDMLVAMAGERLHLPGFTEVSGVCTHPDHRGRRYAALLTRTVAAGIAARGERAFLHSYAGNAAAIALYESLGFAIRTEVMVTLLSVSSPPT